MDSFLKANWGKKSRSELRKILGLSDGELMWHAGRLGLPLENIYYVRPSQIYRVYPAGETMVPKGICAQAGLKAGMKIQYELVSATSTEKIIKIKIVGD